MELSNDRGRLFWVTAAGIFYSISLHKFVNRTGSVSDTGIQGEIEFLAVTLALLCACIGVQGAARRSPMCLSTVCFASFGVLALASSWQSFNLFGSLAKNLILFAVLAIVYLTAQAGLATRFLQSIYWTYTSSLVFYLLLSLLSSTRFPIWETDEWSGRARLSVFGTFPGTMGETAAYLVLLAPLIFKRSHWISTVFLVLINVAAGGKTSTALLILLVLVKQAVAIRYVRSWRFVSLFAVAVLALATVPVAFTLWSDLSTRASWGLSLFYGNKVSMLAGGLDGRVDLWRSTIGLVADSPLMGYGIDGARDALMRIAPWAGSSHNAYIDLALSGGILAFIAFMAGVQDIVWRCWLTALSFRLSALSLLIFMMVVAITSITFSFPSFFGVLILMFLSYDSWNHPIVSSQTIENRARSPSPM